MESQARDKLAPLQSEFSETDRRFLLSVAREAIRAAVDRTRPEFLSPDPRFKVARGVFVSLHRIGADEVHELRGCVGDPLGSRPLLDGVAHAAIGAAFYDPRFPPLDIAELQQIRISISVLSHPFAIAPEEIEIGRHGLFVAFGSRRGLLLPQVAVEYRWDVETFLEQTCRKAGLAPDAWKRAAIEAFTTENFSEQP
jgi:AmmeMemoRadiSam system protein A